MKTRRLTVTFLGGITLAVAMSLAPAATLWANPVTTAPPPPSMATVQASYGQLPLSFEANQGQVDPQVQFLTRGRGHQLFLTPSDAVLALRTGEVKGDGRAADVPQGQFSNSPSSTSHSVVRMRFEGANSHAEMVGLDQLPGIVNYFIGGDPSKWRTNIPTYKKVEYKNVYPGIDLIYYGNEGQLEYDLIVAPGADPTQITLAFDGAEEITVDQHGDLVLTMLRSSTDSAQRDTAALRLHKPVVYQMSEHGDKHLLDGTYVLLVSETSPLTPHVAFEVASYDTNKPLIIDPVLSWATYLGGSGTEALQSIAVDQAGNAYVTGHTNTATGFPGTVGSSIVSTNGAFQGTYGGGTYDIFVTKLNAAGTALVYSTYLGGSGEDVGEGIAVDQAGNAYVIGYTDTASGFPGITAASIQSAYAGGGHDAFVTKLNAAGTTLVYSTYLGTSGEDQGWGIAVDAGGNAYVTGFTNAPGFPGTNGSSIVSTNGAIQGTFGGSSGSGGNYGDAFVTKLNAAGTALVYSTYLGGSNDDAGYHNGIAVDQFGSAYVTGFTATGPSGFPGTAGSSIVSTNGAIQGTNAGGQDAFVTKLNAAGTTLVYSTYLGGSGIDISFGGIAVDQAGNAYVFGQTNTPSGFPGTAGSSIVSTNGAFQGTYGGGTWDSFVTKLNAAGTALLYSTYLGGSGSDEAGGIAVNQAGQAYVTGLTTTPSGFPGITGSSIQSTNAGDFDAFVTKLNAAGTALLYSTYLGGSGIDHATSIAVDQAGQAYVTGGTNTPSGFPGTAGSSIQSTNAGGDRDGFVAKIQFVTPVSIDIKPGSFPNSINLGSNGVVPVAILGSATFDASQIDPLTVTMADAQVKLKGKGTPMASLQDVNGDGFLDLVVQVSTSTLQLTATNTEAIVEGATVGGTPFRGKDSLNIVP